MLLRCIRCALLFFPIALHGFEGVTRTPEYFAPWIDPLLEPSWGIEVSSLHGKIRSASSSAVDTTCSSRVALPSSLELDLGATAGALHGTYGYPRLSFLLKKQLWNDLAPKETGQPVALALAIDGAFSSHARVRQLIFQEFGILEGGVSLSLGKHLAVWSNSRYVQLYATFRGAKSSSGVSSLSSSLCGRFVLARHHSFLVEATKSHGNDWIKGCMGGRRRSLSPRFYELSCEYAYNIPAFGTFSLTVGQRVSTSHHGGRWTTAVVSYTTRFAI